MNTALLLIGKWFTAISSLLLFTGCNCCLHYLTVQTDYLRREQLASYHIHTPDPALSNPLIGQRLIVSWSLPQSYLEYPDLHLELSIRYVDRTQENRKIHVTTTSGTYIEILQEENFLIKKGFLTYKVDLIGNGCLLDQWRHQLWVDLIDLNVELTDLPE